MNKQDKKRKEIEKEDNEKAEISSQETMSQKKARIVEENKKQIPKNTVQVSILNTTNNNKKGT